MGMTIGYLTDIHLRKEVSGTSSIEKRHTRDMTKLLPVALAQMCRESPDMIVCTGDVLDVPTGPGVVQDLKLCKKFFDDCGTPYVVLPGNHDPLPDDFYRVFPVPEKRLLLNNCELIFFHEDACFNGEQSIKRSERSLHEMADILMRTKSCPETTLLFQHYVIYPDYKEGYRHNYQNDDKIRNILEQSNRRLLSISGHMHSGIPMIQKNGVSYFAGRAFCEAPYTCYIINISGNEIVVKEFEMEKEL